MSRVYEVYVPIAVTVDLDGLGHASAVIDYDGAPWMYVLEQDNVWDPAADDGGGEWVSEESSDETRAASRHAVEVLNWMLDRPGSRSIREEEQ